MSMLHSLPIPFTLAQERIKMALRAGSEYSALPRAKAAQWARLVGNGAPADSRRHDRTISMLRDTWMHTSDRWAKAKVWHSFSRAFTAALSSRQSRIYAESMDRYTDPARFAVKWQALMQLEFDALSVVYQPHRRHEADYWQMQRVAAAMKINWGF